MSSIIDALYILKYNPFKYGEHVATFYSSITNVGDNLLLAPLVIPLCSHPVFSKKLTNANTKSTIWTIFNDRTEMHDLQERIDDFQNLTEQCIQYCLINDWLLIEENSLDIQYITNQEHLFVAKKNANNLGRLFSGHSVVEIYAFLGVKPH